MPPGVLSGVRVVEVGGQVSAAYCGKVLALLGAEVIKVEPPGGDAARRAGPFPGNLPHPEKSGLFLALNLNKFGITLDLALPRDRRRFRTLARSAAVLVGDAEEFAAESEAWRRENPDLIVTSVSPFGNWGPYAGFKASDLVLFHMSGQASGMLGPVADGDAQPPIRAGGRQAELVTGLAAATATLMALFRRQQTGQGCHVQVSGFEAMVTQLISALANCAFDRPPPARVAPAEVVSVGGVLPCRDGHVAISPREDAQWARWVELMGQPAWASEERFRTREGRERHLADLWELVGQWTRLHGKHGIARRGQAQRIPCFPVNTVRDLFNDAHLKYRRFFREIEHPVAGPLTYPGVPYRFSGLELPLAARPAPLLGEHNARILGPSAPAASIPRPVPGNTRTGQVSNRLPLDGVRVVDLSWIIAGPTAAR
ncbi:MAG: CoA transferase, partial [Candidatus Tectomicrobia bacterium]|nr:CoA transferase [Candidatus Tectomicrobia bacterium]